MAMALPDSIPRRLTSEDLLQLPEDGLRHELIGGEHFMAPAPSSKHQIASFNLSYFFGDYLRRNPLGRALAAPFDIVLSDEDVVEPDLVFISNERAGILTERNARGAPDLIVEILSQGTRRLDETLKLQLYERAGVSEYWLIDPGSEGARVFRREGGRLVQVRTLSAATGDVLDTPLLPGLAIPLAEVFC